MPKQAIAYKSNVNGESIHQMCPWAGPMYGEAFGNEPLSFLNRYMYFELSQED